MALHGREKLGAGNQVTDQDGRVVAAPPREWAIQHEPAANTQATITKAAETGKRHVATSLVVTMSSQAAPAAIRVLARLRDGASGAGTILWTAGVSLPATAGASSTVVLDDLQIEGSENTALTLEFSAAGGANVFETVSLTGYTA